MNRTNVIKLTTALSKVIEKDIQGRLGKISKHTTYKNRLKRMKSMLQLRSMYDASRIVVKRPGWFDSSFVDFCRNFR